MKAIILCGGYGSRLRPMTTVVNKHLLPVGGKPMVYYPLALAIQSGFTHILISTNQEHISNFKLLLGDGEEFGIEIEYGYQSNKGGGIAAAIADSKEFINGEPFAVFLGDNIVFGPHVSDRVFSDMSHILLGNISAGIYSYFVPNPSAFGVLNKFNTKIVEKPKKPQTHKAVCGIYVYCREAVDVAKSLKPSSRGEVEVTDLNNHYLSESSCNVYDLSDSGALWLDTGTPESIRAGDNVISGVEQLSHKMVGSPHIEAHIRGLINLKDPCNMPPSYYKQFGSTTDYIAKIDKHLKQLD